MEAKEIRLVHLYLQVYRTVSGFLSVLETSVSEEQDRISHNIQQIEEISTQNY